MTIMHELKPDRTEMNRSTTVLIQSDSQLSLCSMVENDMEFLRHLYRTTRDDIDQLNLPDKMRAQILDQQFEAQHAHYLNIFPNAKRDIVLSGYTQVGRLYVQYGFTGIQVIDITILPAFRNSGIGTAVMRGVLDRSRLEKVPVRLRVIPGSPAVRWYTRMGFRKIADEQSHWQMEWDSSERGATQ